MSPTLHGTLALMAGRLASTGSTDTTRRRRRPRSGHGLLLVQSADAPDHSRLEVPGRPAAARTPAESARCVTVKGRQPVSALSIPRWVDASTRRGRHAHPKESQAQQTACARSGTATHSSVSSESPGEESPRASELQLVELLPSRPELHDSVAVSAESVGVDDVSAAVDAGESNLVMGSWSCEVCSPVASSKRRTRPFVVRRPHTRSTPR